ncbi:MAG: hypothetical protein DVB31_08770 [Verrucomicrobia bacterium]|nr:MAG: hypothetical protein DVB31_08770 [Verrucomicrobiota bacterium]
MELRLPKDPAYERICSGHTPTGSASYWLGRDHLLLVETSFVTEQCRRFELRDLELVVVQPTSTRLVAGSVLACAFVVLLSLAAIASFRAASSNASDAAIWAVLAGIPTVVLGAALAWVVLPGRFCRVRIRTGVQTLAAPGISRLPKATRFVARLRAALAPTVDAAPAAPLAPQPAAGNASTDPAP